METTPVTFTAPATWEACVAPFWAARATDTFLRDQLAAHTRRVETARRVLRVRALARWERADLQVLLQDTDAWHALRRDRRAFWEGVFGARDERLPALRAMLTELVQRGTRGLTAETFDALRLPEGMGPTYLAELLAMRFPERYWPWTPAVRALAGTRGTRGAAYFAAGAALAPVRAALEAEAGHAVDYLTVSALLAWCAHQPQAEAVREARVAYRTHAPEAWAAGFPGFRAETFAFLDELAAHNAREWLSTQRARYQRVLREPLRALCQALAPHIAALDAELETEPRFGKVLATLARSGAPAEPTGERDAADAPFFTHLGGAFYRRGTNRRHAARFFVSVHGDGVRAGLAFSTGVEGGLARWRHNAAQAPELVQALCAHLPAQVVARWPGRAGPFGAEADWADVPAGGSLILVRHYAADDARLQRPDLVEDLAGLWRALYPFWQIATASELDAMQAASALSDAEPALAAESVPAEDARYAIEQLCVETGYAQDFWRRAETLLEDKRQLVFYGPPGTGKTWLAQRFARWWVEAGTDPAGVVEVLQLHPAYAYEDFVEGLRPESRVGPDGRAELVYVVRRGLFRRLCETARLHPARRYALVLDELNRADLPRVLGELLYLLEYRQAIVRLPYSGDAFAIPPNLCVVGTMNTADRSLALVDHALRRRFHFIALRPDPARLRAYLAEQGCVVWPADVLERVNAQLAQDGFDWHMQIGHSHFMRPDLDEARAQLIWEHGIWPVLEDYFYRQPERLGDYQWAALRAAAEPDDADA